MERKEIQHNMVNIAGEKGGYFHIIPEAVYDDERVELCSRCTVGFENQNKPEQRKREVSREAQTNREDAEQNENMDVDMIDQLDYLYYDSAPQNTVAAGEVFGNLKRLEEARHHHGPDNS